MKSLQLKKGVSPVVYLYSMELNKKNLNLRPPKVASFTRYRPRFFDQVGHQTINASIGNRHFSLYHVIIRPTKIIKRADKNWAHF